MGRSGAHRGPALGDLSECRGKAEVVKWLEVLQQVYAENRQWLTELDSAIGDADHGINMDRGFTAVKAELAGTSSVPISVLFFRACDCAHPPRWRRRRAAVWHFLSSRRRRLRRENRIEAADAGGAVASGVEGVGQRG